MLALMQLYSCSVFYCFMYPYKMHIFWMYLVYIYYAKFYFRNLFLKSISLIDEIYLTVVTHMHTFYDLSEKVSIHIYMLQDMYMPVCSHNSVWPGIKIQSLYESIHLSAYDGLPVASLSDHGDSVFPKSDIG